MRVLGMSSGTSVDAIDLAVAEFSGDGELLRLRPIHWLAVPIGIVLLLLLLQSGSRTPSEFIYFQF